MIEQVLAAKIIATPTTQDQSHSFGNKLDIKSSSLWFCSYGERVKLAFPDGDQMRIQFRYRGEGRTALGQQHIAITSDQACISPSAAEIDFLPGFRQVVWRSSQSDFRQRAEHILDSDAVALDQIYGGWPLRESKAALASGVLRNMLRLADHPMLPSVDTIMTELEDAFVMAIVLSLEARMTQQKSTAQLAPWQVRRAEAFIEANWQSPITIEKLVDVAGCSARTLFRSFKQTRGCSPLEFVRQTRLDQARRLLAEPLTGTTVTDIALLCGFEDVSRFSRYFAERFGMLPSTLLRNSRR